MFKKITAILLTIIMIIGTFCMLGCGGNNKTDANTGELTPEEKIAQSEFLYPDKTEDFRYNKYTHYVKITQCLSLKSNIVIPDTIAGLPVYEIEQGAFRDQLTITSVHISDNVFIIGESAFAGCANLKEVKLPKNIKTLGGNAFSGSSLKHIEFPNTLLEIPSGVCSNCSQLTYLIINEPDVIGTNEETGEPIMTGARTLNGGAFSNCPSLKYIWIPEDVTMGDNKIGSVDEHVVIYGYAKSSAAQVAANSYVDFHLVQSKAEMVEFKNKAELASDTVTLSGNEDYKGALVNLQIEKTFVVREKINYQVSFENENRELITNTFEYTPEKNSNLIIFGVKITNNSAQNITFNQLGSSIKVDTYYNRFVNLGTIKNSALSKYASPNYTTIAPDETAYVYFASEIDDEWEEIDINFGNFTELLNYNFIIKNDENIIYVGTESEEEPVTDEPNEEVTEPNTEVVTDENGEPVTSEDPGSEPVSESSSEVLAQAAANETTTEVSTTQTS